MLQIAGPCRPAGSPREACSDGHLLFKQVFCGDAKYLDGRLLLQKSRWGEVGCFEALWAGAAALNCHADRGLLLPIYLHPGKVWVSLTVEFVI